MIVKKRKSKVSRCKAILSSGRRCTKLGYLNGYCTYHYILYKYKKGDSK